MFVAGIDGCRGGWVSFKVGLASLNTSVEHLFLHTLDHYYRCLQTPFATEGA